MTVGERFKKIREFLGFEQKTAFAQKCGVNSQYIADIESGKKNPAISIMNVLHENWDVNLHFLITGQGAMFVDSSASFEKPQNATDSEEEKMVKAALEECKKEKERAWQYVEYFKTLLEDERKKEAS